MGQAVLELTFDDDEAAEKKKRAATRAEVYVSVDVTSEHNFWTGLTMNMSEGGVFVATYHEVPVGTRLAVNMLLPFEQAPVVVEAEVRWTRAYSGQDDVPPGIGLQFIDLDPGAHAKIRRFVQTLREPLFYDD